MAVANNVSRHFIHVWGTRKKRSYSSRISHKIRSRWF